MLEQYLSNKQGSLSKEDPDSDERRIYVVMNNYAPLIEYLRDYTCLVFVDDYKYAYNGLATGYEIKLNDLAIILTLLKSVPLGSFDMIVIDSTDFMAGDIVPLHSFCVENKIGITFVAGQTQSEAFFKYNSFLQNCAGPVFQCF